MEILVVGVRQILCSHTKELECHCLLLWLHNYEWKKLIDPHTLQDLLIPAQGLGWHVGHNEPWAHTCKRGSAEMLGFLVSVPLLFWPLLIHPYEKSLSFLWNTLEGTVLFCGMSHTHTYTHTQREREREREIDNGTGFSKVWERRGQRP